MNDERIGIVIVDHGSRRQDSNEMLLSVVESFRDASAFEIVEPAHMELAEPSIATAFARCVQQGANLVIVHPYFLLPGRHWHQDIPELCVAAASNHPNTPYLVTAPLGLHPLMSQVVKDRVEHCLAHARGSGPTCDVCVEQTSCQLRMSPATES